MATVQAGAQGVFAIGNPPGSSGAKLLDFSTPAGWALLWWGSAVLLLILIFWSL